MSRANNDGGYVTYRQFDLDADLPRLARLLAAVEAVDQTGEDVREETLREQLTVPGHDAAHDRWVAETTETVEGRDGSNSLIGYGGMFKTALSARADVFIATHPERRRQGIGGELLRRLMARAREQGATSIGAYAADSLTASVAFLRAQGFAPIAAYTEMGVSGDATFPAPQWPDGFTVRAYADMQDEAIFREAANRCYAGLWGHNTVSEADVQTWLPQVDPAGAFLLFAPAGDIAGMCLTQVSKRHSERRGEPTGLIDAPGVVAERRGEDLYLPQTLHALSWLQQQRPAPVSILLESWGDDPATLDLYQHIGFAVTRREVSYRLDL